MSRAFRLALAAAVGGLSAGSPARGEEAAPAAEAGAAATVGEDEEDPRLSAAWPFALFAAETAAFAGGAVGMGWPVDDAMARYAVGLAAGAVPAGALLAVWGRPCGGDVGLVEDPWCWVEGVAQGLLVLGIDATASYFAMRYVMEFPAELSPPSWERTTIWGSGWGGGTALLLMLPPLCGAPWGEDLWSTVGMLAWIHGALSAILVGVLYYAYAEGPADSWEVQLPVFAGAGPW